MRVGVSLSIDAEALEWARAKSQGEYRSLSRYIETLILREKHAEEAEGVE